MTIYRYRGMEIAVAEGGRLIVECDGKSSRYPSLDLALEETLRMLASRTGERPRLLQQYALLNQIKRGEIDPVSLGVEPHAAGTNRQVG